MQSFTYEEYRKELNRHNDIVVYAVIRKNFLHEDDHEPLYSLDIDVEILPKTDEELEKIITSNVFKSTNFDTVIELFEKINIILP